MPRKSRNVKRLCRFCHRTGGVRPGCWECDSESLLKQAAPMRAEGRKLMRAAEHIVRKVDAAKTSDS